VFAYSMQIVVAVLCQISFCFTCRINNILQCFSIVVGFDLFLLDCQFCIKIIISLFNKSWSASFY